MVNKNYLRPPLSTTPSYYRFDSLAIDLVRAAKVRRLRDQAWARYERRRRACQYVLQYRRAKFPGWYPGLNYRITIAHLRYGGFWHRDLRQPRAKRVYYEDLVHLEEQALMLLTRLDHHA